MDLLTQLRAAWSYFLVFFEKTIKLGLVWHQLSQALVAFGGKTLAAAAAAAADTS